MHAAVAIIGGRFWILFAGDSYDGKSTPHNKAIETNRGDFSRHRARPDCRPCHRGRGGAVYHPRAYAVRVESGAARRVRTRRRYRPAAIRSEPSAPRQDAGPTGAASRAACAAEYRAGPDQFANSVGHARRTADRRSATLGWHGERQRDRTEAVAG